MNNETENKNETSTPAPSVAPSLPAVAKPAPVKKLERKEPAKVAEKKPEIKKVEAKVADTKKPVPVKKVLEKNPEAKKATPAPAKKAEVKPDTKKPIAPAKKPLEAKKPLVKAKTATPAKKVPEAPKKALVKKPAEALKNGIPTKGSGKLSQLLCDLLLEKQFTDDEIIAKAQKKHPEKRIDLIIVNHYRRLVNAEGKKVEKLFKVKGKGLVPKNKLTIEEKHALGVRK